MIISQLSSLQSVSVFAHLVVKTYKGLLLEQRMQLVPQVDKGQMGRHRSPSYLSFVIINVLLNVQISVKRRGGRVPRITDALEGVL